MWTNAEFIVSIPCKESFQRSFAVYCRQDLIAVPVAIRHPPSATCRFNSFLASLNKCIWFNSDSNGSRPIKLNTLSAHYKTQNPIQFIEFSFSFFFIFFLNGESSKKNSHKNGKSFMCFVLETKQRAEVNKTLAVELFTLAPFHSTFPKEARNYALLTRKRE